MDPIADRYVKQLNELDASLKRLNLQAKDVRTKKKEIGEKLYIFMERNGLDEYSGYKKKALQPKPRIKSKAPKKRKEDALQLFFHEGIRNPEELWNKLQETQKYSLEKNRQE